MRPSLQNQPTKRSSYMRNSKFSSGDESYFIYSGNSLNQQLRKICGAAAGDNHISEAELDKCMASKPSQPFTKQELVDHLESLEKSTVVVSSREYYQHGTITMALRNSVDVTTLKFEAVSTFQKDGSVAILSSRERSEDYARHYSKVYDTAALPSLDDAFLLNRYDTLLVSNGGRGTEKVSSLDQPILHRTTFSRKYGSIPFYYVLDMDEVAKFKMKDLEHPFNAYEQFKEKIESATKLLSDFHEELTYEQVRILFSGKLVWEMLVLKDEDPLAGHKRVRVVWMCASRTI